MDSKPSLVRRYVKAYLSLVGIIAAFASVSLAKGAGWRPALVGMPLYVTVFIGITYQLIKELRVLNRENPRDPE
jgi:hypothetical protein